MPFDADAIVRRIEAEAASRLLAAALVLRDRHRDDLSAGNPAPHHAPAPRGEFPRLRTGWLRAGVAVEPASPAAVLGRGSVSVGYRPGGLYGLALAGRGWKGIKDTHARERDLVRAVLAGGAG